jgi:Tol biopolymer transport system component
MPAADQPLRERIGPYRIVARVGAGGMGEVFKAWDPRLERDVAIKLLHPEMAGDADRQRRLLAEGRAASALNHPNILRVYDADVDGDSYYLVSEWLEGNSLRQELARGPLPLKRLLDLAVQIADGLAAAHAMGIVHRDIKPENVMLARDGTARIVDFGLARSDPRAPGMASVAAQASTVTLENGLSGTPAYMSPEQARGTQGDFRSDQFSFGALIYEMATGRHAFKRDTMADTLAAVLHDEPKSMVAINPRIPVAVAWIVEQCLAKDAAERYAATEDLARELRRVRERLREALAEPTAATTAARVSPWRMTAAIAGSVIVTAALAVAIIATEPAPPEQRFTPIASTAAYEGEPVWSPNGDSLAWVADVDGVLQVFVRRLADALATQVTNGRFDSERPFWASDGRALYFISAAGEGTGLWTVGAAGGRAELLMESVNHAAIDPSGQRLVLLRPEQAGSLNQKLWWASAKGESPTQELRAPFDSRMIGLGGQLQFRPDGESVLLWAFEPFQTSGQPPSNFYLVSTAADGPVREVLTGISGSANLQPFGWLPDNRHVVVGLADTSGGKRHLWMADTESPALRRVTSTHTNETWPSVSPDGRRIAYASEEVDFDLISISDDGRTRQPALATARNEFDPAWSPAGDQFAFVTDRTGPMSIWVRSRDAQWERPLVSASDFGDSTKTDSFGSLAFSPDGRRLAYQRGGPEGFAVWVTPVTGGTPVRLLDYAADSIYEDAPSWSPDGEWISFVQGTGSRFSLAKVRVGTNEVVQLVDTVVPFSRAIWSPDGKWIVCDTPAGIARVPVDGGPPQVVLPEPLLAYAWAGDSQRIVALAEGETFGHLALIEINAMTGVVKTLNPDLGTIPVAYQPIRGFSYAKGQGFLTSLASARSDIWLLEGFQLPGNRLLRWFQR